MYSMSAMDQYRITLPFMLEVLQGYSSSCVAELTSANNVHYHATVELDSFASRDKFINRTRRYTQFGKRSVTALANELKWSIYLNKDIASTRLILGNPVVKDSLIYFCDPQYRFGLAGPDHNH